MQYTLEVQKLMHRIIGLKAVLSGDTNIKTTKEDQTHIKILIKDLDKLVRFELMKAKFIKQVLTK
tara:strand:- start:315 stop:509 length:195 start_codon:yes stop_codon:yes gene_type:complete